MSDSDELQIARQEIALWKEQRLTKMLLDGMKTEVERLRQKLESIQTTDVNVARLQAAISMRREMLEEPALWICRLEQDKLLDDFDDLNPE